MTTRREFLALSAGAMAAYAAGLKAVEPAAKPLDILFLGGTGFLGPHQINHALARGHKVTMFNRGSNAGMYGDRVEELVGNRDDRIDDGLSPLRGDRHWDVVIDNSGYVPRHVRDSVELLKGRCGRYLFVSTVAVYDRKNGGVFPEDGPLMALENPADEKVTGASYGPLKAECDRYVQLALGDSATVVRPCYIVGPGDHTDRFTYWVDRVARGGEVLAPGGPDLNAHLVDARDLCPWIITLAENDTPGIFNAAGPATAFTREGLMWGLAALGDRPVEFFWPSWAMLEESGFNTPMMRVDEAHTRYLNEASMAAGMHYRSVAGSARDTLQWWMAQPAERRANARRWSTSEQERELVEQIKAGRAG